MGGGGRSGEGREGREKGLGSCGQRKNFIAYFYSPCEMPQPNRIHEFTPPLPLPAFPENIFNLATVQILQFINFMQIEILRIYSRTATLYANQTCHRSNQIFASPFFLRFALFVRFIKNLSVSQVCQAINQP